MGFHNEDMELRDRRYVAGKIGWVSNIDSAGLAFPEVSDRGVLKKRAWYLAQKESTQQKILKEVGKKIPPNLAVDLLKTKMENEGNDSIKALALYFDLVGAKKNEMFVQNESKSLSVNVNVEVDKIQDAIRAAREGVESVKVHVEKDLPEKGGGYGV